MKLCKDCTHHDGRGYNHSTAGFLSHACNFVVGNEDPVTGDIITEPISCEVMRLGPCSLNAIFYDTIGSRIKIDEEVPG